MQFSGYYLDEKNIVSPAVDSEGNTRWYIVTFLNAPINGVIPIGEYGEKFFDMKEIDPNDFEWNGQRLKIDLGGNDEKKNSKALAKRNPKKGRKNKR